MLSISTALNPSTCELYCDFEGPTRYEGGNICKIKVIVPKDKSFHYFYITGGNKQSLPYYEGEQSSLAESFHLKPEVIRKIEIYVRVHIHFASIIKSEKNPLSLKTCPYDYPVPIAYKPEQFISDSSYHIIIKNDGIGNLSAKIVAKEK